MRALRPKPSPAVLLLVGSRRLRGLPVLVHEASRRVWGLRLRRTDLELAISSRPYCLPPMQKRQRPDCIFSELKTQPTCTPVYASLNTLAACNAKLGAERFATPSRRTLSFPASCRFIPAHCIVDLSLIQIQTHVNFWKAEDSEMTAGKLPGHICPSAIRSGPIRSLTSSAGGISVNSS